MNSCEICKYVECENRNPDVKWCLDKKIFNDGYEQGIAVGEERMSNVLTMLSIQAEQHKMILASDIFDILEDIYPNWNKADDN